MPSGCCPSAATERTPRVVSAVKLHRAATRRRTGLFLAEGPNAVGAALVSGHVVELFHTLDAPGELVERADASGVRTTAVTERAARALGDTVTPPGLVAVCTELDVPLTSVLDGRLVAVPIGTADPGNAGTLVRIADAVGADAVVFAGDTVDPHNGKSVRASAGSVFHVPIARERAVDMVLDAVEARGFQLLATAADGELALDDADAVLAAPTAWLFGNEAHGLSPAVAERAHHRVRIPIRGAAESLNLAAAAAICLYASSRVQNRGGSAH